MCIRSRNLFSFCFTCASVRAIRFGKLSAIQRNYHRTRGRRRWEKAAISGFLDSELRANARRGEPSRPVGKATGPPSPSASRGPTCRRNPAECGQNPGIGAMRRTSPEWRARRASRANAEARILTGFSVKSTQGTRVGRRGARNVCRARWLFSWSRAQLATAPSRIRATSSGRSNEEKWPVWGSVIRWTFASKLATWCRSAGRDQSRSL